MASKKQAPAKKAAKKRLTPKREKFVENYLTNGGNGRKAAEDAGYAKGHASETEAYRLLRNAEIRARIAERQADSQVKTDEIVGTLVGQMRGDITDVLPDEDEIKKRARKNNVSHLLKKLKVTRRIIPQKDGEPVEVITHEFEMYSAQEAAKQLCAVFGLNKLPAENPQEAAKAALKSILSETGLSQAKARAIVARTFGVPESDLINADGVM